jgi:hypothetical protein
MVFDGSIAADSASSARRGNHPTAGFSFKLVFPACAEGYDG